MSSDDGWELGVDAARWAPEGTSRPWAFRPPHSWLLGDALDYGYRQRFICGIDPDALSPGYETGPTQMVEHPPAEHGWLGPVGTWLD